MMVDDPHNRYIPYTNWITHNSYCISHTTDIHEVYPTQLILPTQGGGRRLSSVSIVIMDDDIMQHAAVGILELAVGILELAVGILELAVGILELAVGILELFWAQQQWWFHSWTSLLLLSVVFNFLIYMLCVLIYMLLSMFICARTCWCINYGMWLHGR